MISAMSNCLTCSNCRSPLQRLSSAALSISRDRPPPLLIHTAQPTASMRVDSCVLFHPPICVPKSNRSTSLPSSISGLSSQLHPRPSTDQYAQEAAQQRKIQQVVALQSLPAIATEIESTTTCPKLPSEMQAAFYSRHLIDHQYCRHSPATVHHMIQSRRWALDCSASSPLVMSIG